MCRLIVELDSDSKYRELEVEPETKSVALVSVGQCRRMHVHRNRVCVVVVLIRYWRCAVRLFEILGLEWNRIINYCGARASVDKHWI